MLKLLVATDGSPAATHAVRFAARLASELIDARITLLYVRPAPRGLVLSPGVPGPRTEEALAEAVSVAERELLDAAAALFGAVAHPVERVVEVGDPADTIIRCAAAGGYDLVVVGSRSYTELHDLLAGSVTSSVVRHAPCPVLVVR